MLNCLHHIASVDFKLKLEQKFPDHLVKLMLRESVHNQKNCENQMQLRVNTPRFWMLEFASFTLWPLFYALQVNLQHFIN